MAHGSELPSHSLSYQAPVRQPTSYHSPPHEAIDLGSVGKSRPPVTSTGLNDPLAHSVV